MTIDPLSVNRQGGDVGTQYRTGIYYEEYHQKYLDKNPGGYCHIPASLMNMRA